MSALDDVKSWIKINYAEACAAFSIPCEPSSKEHDCPLCGKKKFRVFMSGARAGQYVCTCGVKGCGFGTLDLIARKELGASCDDRIPGTTIRKAAMLVDERLGLGYFSSDPGYSPPTDEEKATRERERKEVLEQQQRESREQEQKLIEDAAPRVRDILSKATEAECAYLKEKGFVNDLLPVTARGDGVVRLTDIDNRDRSVQYLPSAQSVDEDGKKRPKSLMKNAPIAGAFIDVQPNDKANTLIITEGYATALSVAIAAPLSRVIAAMNATNLQNVATAFRDRFPALEIIIAADNDYHAPGDVDRNGHPCINTGLLKAVEAARATGAQVAAPDCLGDVKQDWDDVRMQLGEEIMTDAFANKLDEAGKKKASGKETLDITVSGSNISPPPKKSNPTIKTASYPRVPNSVDIANCRCPDHFKKYYSDRTTPQEIQPDGTPYLAEREGGEIICVTPRTGRGEDGASGKFKHAMLEAVISGIKPILRGFKDNELYTTFASNTDSERRASIPAAADTKRLSAELRSIGAVVSGGLIDLWRNAYLPEQSLPTAIYGSAPGWHEHEREKFYVSQAGKTYLIDKLHFEFTSPVEPRFKAAPAGTLEEYQSEVIDMIRGNDGLVFQMLIELAAVLFPVRNRSTRAEGLTLNIYGASGKGKTLSLKLGASIWGDYSRLTESANATYTAMVNSAVKSSGGVMRIDDLSAMGNIRGSDIENLIYSIGNGKGKLRSAIDGKNIQADEFSVICLMTAEKPIADELWEKENYRFKAGAEARLIEQPFVELTDLKGEPGIRPFAERLTHALNQYHGSLGIAWLKLLHKKGWDDIQAELKTYCQKFDTYMKQDGLPGVWDSRPGHKVRAHQIYSVAYAAGMMSLELTGLDESDILNAAMMNIIVEMDSNNSGEKRDTEATAAFWDYLTANTASMGAIAREGNKANAQRGGNECAGWLDLIETDRQEESLPVFYLNKNQLNAAAREVCGMAGGDLLTLLTRYGYHETPDTERGSRDGTVQKRVRSGQATCNMKLIKISEPPEEE